jgi:hypothetical protein
VPIRAPWISTVAECTKFVARIEEGERMTDVCGELALAEW